MNQYLKHALNCLDEQLALACLAMMPEQPALLVFTFHVLFEDEAALARGEVDPQQCITVAMLDQLIVHFLAHNYIFVTPAEVLRGLDAHGHYALLTFDDGYYNHRLALPVLQRHKVPGTFFISSHHVLTGQAFWWDVVYRARQRHALPPQEQAAEYKLLKELPYADIDAYLTAQFGAGALQPMGDLDRPFTPEELRDFARQPEVTLGNHTAHHAFLPNYSLAAATQELADCQRDLLGLSGVLPQAVAYPYGDVSASVVAAATAAKLYLGVTVETGKNYLPFTSSHTDLLRIRRFTLWGTQNIARQCKLFRTDFHLKKRLRQLVKP